MPRFHKDTRGVLIEEGQLVAYNRSGDVIEGTVLDASSSGHIKIEPNTAFWPRPNCGFSRVRSGRQVLVLQAEDSDA